MMNRSNILQVLATVVFIGLASLTFGEGELFGGNLISLVVPGEVVAMNQQVR